MRQIIVIFSFLFLASIDLYSQKSINDYKYIIVPLRYDFLKADDQHQLNSLTKFLFNKKGFISFMQNDELPQDYIKNRCLGLYAEVVEIKAFLNTKLQINLKDCNGEIIISSRVGETKEKDYSKAYNIALRSAFETFQNINYTYKPNSEILSREQPKSSVEIEVDEAKKEIERLQEELNFLKEDKNPSALNSEKVVTLEDVKSVDIIETKPKNVELLTLYAQPIDNGFQIVDTTPKKVMILFYSGVTNTFIVKDRNAIVYKRGDNWILAENDGKDLRSEVLNIKF